MISVLALVVALVAVGLAVWALLKGPDSNSASVFTGTKTDDPKGSICEAFNVIRNGVQINTNLQPPGGPEDINTCWRGFSPKRRRSFPMPFASSRTT